MARNTGMENAIQRSRSLLQFSAASQVRDGSWSICKARARLTRIKVCSYCGMPAINSGNSWSMTPRPFFGPSKIVSGGRSRNSQIMVSLGCAIADEVGPMSKAVAASAHITLLPCDRQSVMSSESRRFSLDGPVFTQLCDLFLVVAKIVEYLRIVFAQLRPDPLRTAGCL
ncbi:hypothetical protein D3C84_613150 [compost metagenome]